MQMIVPAMPVVLALLLAGCTDSLLEPRPQTLPVAQFVTGDAARGLNATGHFNLATSAGGASELTRLQAEAFAQAWATQVAPQLQGLLETGHGGPINLARLRVCRESVYAASSFEPLDSTVPTSIRAAFGGWWLVALCEGPQVDISLAVESIASGLTLDGGQLRFAPDSNFSHFFGVGVPGSWDGPLPISAEAAVVRAGQETGLRVNAVPQLIAPSHLRGPPQAALWLLSLDGSVAVRGSGTERGGTVTAIYEGLLGVAINDAPLSQPPPTLAIPLEEQPTFEVVGGPSFPLGQFTLRIKSGTPIWFEAATVARGGG